MQAYGGQITEIWLITGKKLIVNSQCAQVQGVGFVIRTSDCAVLIVPADKVASVTVAYKSKEEVGAIFEGAQT